MATSQKKNLLKKGLMFETDDFDGLTIETNNSDLEKRKKELEEELAKIKSRLIATTPAS